MKEINKYAKNLVKNLDLSLKEKKELELQYIDHITELFNSRKLEGFSDKDSFIYAIETFKENNKESKFKTKEIILISFFILYMILFLVIFIAISRLEVFHKRFSAYDLIPFQYFLRLIESFKSYEYIAIRSLKQQIILFLIFIPMGIFIPLISKKYKSFIINFKKFIYLALGVEIIKLIIGLGHFRIDYFLLHLLACLTGFGLFKLMLYLFKKISLEN